MAAGARSANGSSSAFQNQTVAERVARGKTARRAVPRSSHAVFQATPDRADPIVLLERQAESRVPELVPIRYGRMLVSPLTFYRGAATIMARDLASTPHSGLTVQCCGDAHLSNFGVFASPERRMMFDVNDFDETLPGPWEWDVKRLAVSMLIAALDNGFAVKDQDQIVIDTVEAYRTAMASFATMKNLDVWYAHLDIDVTLAELGPQLARKLVKRTRNNLAKARTRDSMSAFSKLTRVVDGRARIVSEPPLIVPLDELVQGSERDQMFEWLRELLRSYRETPVHDRRVLLEQFRLVDFARKVVGVGGVGTRAWIALMLGNDGQDPLFLQMKEAECSVLEASLGPSDFANHGERVVAGQRLMQATSDIFLGWLHVESTPDGRARDFYGRQLKDWKGSAEIEQMIPKGMAQYGRLCGWTLARAHARVPRQELDVRSRDRGVLPCVCRAERARLPRTGRGSPVGARHSQGRLIASAHATGNAHANAAASTAAEGLMSDRRIMRDASNKPRRPARIGMSSAT